MGRRRRREKTHTVEHREIGLGLLLIVDCKAILLFISKIRGLSNAESVTVEVFMVQFKG